MISKECEKFGTVDDQNVFHTIVRMEDDDTILINLADDTKRTDLSNLLIVCKCGRHLRT